ncbi:MAG: hypothetical protein IAF38_04000, partial [Bacteroidia bacterium]|nr:hypothetical protein [Bacteroidia bacterium]
MNPFLLQTAQYISNEYKGKFQNLCIVLPNKRGALFLKKHLRQIEGGAIWVPKVISIEELVEGLSELVCPDSITLTIELYNCWISIEKNKEETFQNFIKWSNTVLQDFNELDRHLVNADDLFLNLSDIRHIENWSLSEEPLTDFQKRYLNFMDNLGELYKRFREKLLKAGMGWQGLAYRMAVNNLNRNNFLDRYEKIVFCGFNALNRSEKEIFSKLVEKGKAEILWDIDEYYFNDASQEAGDFLRSNFKKEALRSDKFIGNELLTEKKEIEITGTPRSMGQVIAAGDQVKKWIDAGLNKENMAIVLADESLLFPMLSAMPDVVSVLNITLEYPLHLTAVYDFYEQLLHLQVQAETKNRSSLSFYFKDLYKLFYNPCFRLLFEGGGESYLQEI